MSLFDDIKESAEGRELSTRWYRGKITSMGGNSMTARQHINQGNSTARPNYDEFIFIQTRNGRETALL